MKFATYKVVPYKNELFCDCGHKMRADFDLGKLFTSCLNKEASEYKYVCEHCGKEYISDKNLNLEEVYYKYTEVVEEKEI